MIDEMGKWPAPSLDRGTHGEVIPAEEGEIEAITFGKLVREGTRAIYPGGGYEVTTKTSGITDEEEGSQLRITKIIETSYNFRVDSIAEEMQKAGALFIRSYKDRNYTVASRTGFHPEDPEGVVSNRVFQVARTLKIPIDFWNRHAEFLGGDVLTALSAVPDTHGPQEERVGVSPIHMRALQHTIPNSENLDQDAQYIAGLLLNKRDREIVVPSERFESEEVFLRALGRAVETLRSTHPENVANLSVAIGYTGPLSYPWICFTPAQPKK